ERLTNVRPFVFTMETEDGAKYYLQATTKREMQKWISQLAKIGKNTSEKRRTYVGPASGHPQENMLPAARNLGRHPTAVFSVPLDFLIEREYGSIQVGAIPKFLEACLEEVETRGFIEDGIYRISGSKLQIDRLKAELNAASIGSHVKFEEQDIHNICSLIKLWIREIPEGLFPGECFWLAAEAVREKAVHKLPLAHFNALRRLMEHLSVASTHEDVTRMAEKQFSLVFGQTVFTPPESEGVKAIGA
ncbi:12130_t:CDS:2, partial [Acaulospora colombiana]